MNDYLNKTLEDRIKLSGLSNLYQYIPPINNIKKMLMLFSLDVLDSTTLQQEIIKELKEIE